MQFKIVLKPIKSKCMHTEEAIPTITMQLYVMSLRTNHFISFPFV